MVLMTVSFEEVCTTGSTMVPAHDGSHPRNTLVRPLARSPGHDEARAGSTERRLRVRGRRTDKRTSVTSPFSRFIMLRLAERGGSGLRSAAQGEEYEEDL